MIEPVHESGIRVYIPDTALLCTMAMILKKDISIYYWKENLYKDITSEYSYFYEEFTWPSVQFSHSVMSDSLRPHGLQHTRPPCPLPTSGVYSNLCPLSWWCHPAISSSVIPFSSCFQSFPASGSFQMSQFLASGAQSIRISASTSVFPKNIQD